MKINNLKQNLILKRALNVYQKQHEAISKNIKNVNKDSYKRVNTDFSHDLTTAASELEYQHKSLRTNHDRHLDEGPPWESKIQSHCQEHQETLQYDHNSPSRTGAANQRASR